MNRDTRTDAQRDADFAAFLAFYTPTRRIAAKQPEPFAPSGYCRASGTEYPRGAFRVVQPTEQ